MLSIGRSIVDQHTGKGAILYRTHRVVLVAGTVSQAYFLGFGCRNVDRCWDDERHDVLALVLALVAVFAKSVNAWIHKPQLRPLLNQLPGHSQLVFIDGKGWWQVAVPLEIVAGAALLQRWRSFCRPSERKMVVMPSILQHLFLFVCTGLMPADQFASEYQRGIDRSAGLWQGFRTCILKFDTEIQVVKRGPRSNSWYLPFANNRCR